MALLASALTFVIAEAKNVPLPEDIYLFIIYLTFEQRKFKALFAQVL